MNKNEMNSKPQRAQGGMGLLSQTISVQNPQVSMAKNPSPREERERTKRERGRREESCCSVLVLVKRQKEREREGERVRGFLTPTTLNPKD